jgi:hypothetical protein
MLPVARNEVRRIDLQISTYGGRVLQAPEINSAAMAIATRRLPQGVAREPSGADR